ncbi:MAG: glycosyltransferase [Candidatus Hodarchaeota archaeon]
MGLIASIIIPVLNEEENIIRCLESVFALNLNRKDYEVILIDNGSIDDTVKNAKKYPIDLLLIEPNTTIAGLRNLGACKAKSAILAFLDADCVASSEWLNRALDNLIYKNNDPRIVATGSRYKVPKQAGFIERVWFGQRSEDNEFVNYLNAGNFIIRKNVFDSINGFDEKLTTGEDSEICMRLTQHGYKILSDEQITVIHFGNPKNIYQFFKKQMWQAQGMLGTYRLHKMDKPLIMTSLFLIGLIITILSAFNNLIGLNNNLFLFTLLLSGFIPIVTSIFRVFQYKNPSLLLPLILLYSVYYLARSVVLVKIFCSYFTKHCFFCRSE